MGISRWSVANRLMFGFGVLGSMLILILVFATLQMNAVSRLLDDLTTDRMPTVARANLVVNQINDIARASYLLFVDTSPSFRQEMFAQMDSAKALIDEELVLLKAATRSSEGLRLYDRLQDSVQTMHRHIGRLKSQVETGQLDAARANVVDIMRPALLDSIRSTEAYINFQTALAHSEATTSNDNVRFTEWSLIIVGALAIVISLSFSYRVTRSLLQDLGAEPRTLWEASNAVARGELDYPLHVKSGDQQSVVAAMAVMQTQLQENRRKADENARIRTALDQVDSAVMIIDNHRTIIYANESMVSMLARHRNELRQQVSDLDEQKLIGRIIDPLLMLGTSPQQLLAQLDTRLFREMRIGALHFDITINPVLDLRNQRIGFVIEWQDKTRERRIQQEIAAVIQATTSGDFSGRIDIGNKENFFLTLANGINSMTESTQSVLNDIVRVMSALGQGNLQPRIEREYQGTFGQLKNDVNNTMDRLRDMVAAIRESAFAIASASAELSAGNIDLSARTEEQASNLEETASSMEELSITVKHNADNAKQASALARDTSSQAQRGGQMVHDVVMTMSRINESARKIAEIISVIDTIAFQTNILALNAAVEAARAGEQGRGFAVVAGEVRNLAQRSATAAKEIKQLIADSVDRIGHGDKQASQAGEAIQEIVESVHKVATLMSEISNASTEQARGIEQINTAVVRIDDTTQHNAALVEEAAATAESMNEQASALKTTVAFFKVGNEASQEWRSAPVNPRRHIQSPRQSSSTGARQTLPPPPSSEDDDWAEF